MSTLITLDNATLNYGRRDVLEDLEFTIEQGERLELGGPNGGGETPRGGRGAPLPQGVGLPRPRIVGSRLRG